VIAMKNQFFLTSSEIAFNKLFAVLLILVSLPLLLNIITLPTVLMFSIFSLVLWFGKKYRLMVSIIFFIFALGVYFVPIPPIGWGFLRMVKEARINGFTMTFEYIYFIAPVLFVSLSLRNILGNIVAYFKNGMNVRSSYVFVSFGIIMSTLLAFPLFSSIALRNQAILINGTGELSTVVLQQTLTFVNQYQKEDGFMATIDQSTNTYTYRLRLNRPLIKDIQFTKVEVDGDEVNFLTDSRITCVQCQKSKEKPFSLVFPANKEIDFIITSDRMIKAIYFTELENRVDEFIFWK
jgi:hypothetical protein